MNPDYIDKKDILLSMDKSLKSISDSLKRIADITDGSKEVIEFTEELKEQIIQENRKRLESRCYRCGSDNLGTVRFIDQITGEPIIMVTCRVCGWSKKFIDNMEEC